MKIVTTPMCEEILKILGIKQYCINKCPTKNDGDLAILLSESKVDMDAIHIKLNTFKQIKESIEKIADYFNLSYPEAYFNECPIAEKYLNNPSKSSIRIKVYSKFLRDIVEDMGFKCTDKNYDYVVAPDYLFSKIIEENVPIIEIPSHGNVSQNPIMRACMRYKILEDFINKEY